MRRDYETTKIDLVEMVREYPEDTSNRDCILFDRAIGTISGYSDRVDYDTKYPVCIIGHFFVKCEIADQEWLNSSPLSEEENYKILMRYFDDSACRYLIEVQDLADSGRTWWTAVDYSK